MDVASMAMIEVLHQKKGLTRLDAYSLASLTMDCRLDNPTAEVQRVHCFVPKSLWVKKN
jgi:acetamidase/formamidase